MPLQWILVLDLQICVSFEISIKVRELGATRVGFSREGDGIPWYNGVKGHNGSLG